MAAESTETEKTENTEAPEESLSTAAKGPIKIGQSYRVYPTVPIPELDTPTARAFKAMDTSDPTAHVMAYVCQPKSLPRVEEFSTFRGNQFHAVLTMHDWEVAFWPPFGHRTTIFIYDKPLGGRLSTVLGQRDKVISVHDIAEAVIVPLTQAMKSLSSRGAPHRNIRPDNLFYKDEERTELVLGECLSCPPGFNQPVVYEPIEKGMCHRAGRGSGRDSDDLYAIAVTVLSLILEKRRTELMSDEDIIDLKIDVGSFRAIVGDEPMLPKLVEPLRGLLIDDALTRWSFEDLEFWIEGRRQRPQQRPRTKAAKRPLKFAGEEYASTRPLARAIAKPANREHALQILRGGGLENWIRRGLEDNDTGQAIHTATQTSATFHTDAAKADDILISKTCMFLDTDAPIRYKGFAFMVEGFGTAFAYEYMQENRGRIPIEALACDLVGHWIDAKGSTAHVAGNQKQEFGRYKNFLTMTDPGYGVERCLYETCQALHCLSPLIEQDHITEIGDVLTALDDAAKRVDPQTQPLDRHLAAFIATKASFSVEKHLKAYASTDPEVRILGMLSVLAVLQWKMKVGQLLGLSSWAGGLMAPALSVYQSRTTKRAVEKEIPRIVREGSLPDLYNLFDNTERINKDYKDFQIAKAEYQEVDMEIGDIKSVAVQAERAEQLGQQTAAVAGIVLSLIIVSLTIMMQTV